MNIKRGISLDYILDLTNHAKSLEKWRSLTVNSEHSNFDTYLPVVKPIVHRLAVTLALDANLYYLNSMLAPAQLATILKVYRRVFTI